MCVRVCICVCVCACMSACMRVCVDLFYSCLMSLWDSQLQQTKTKENTFMKLA